MRSTIIGALMASALALPALAQSAPNTTTANPPPSATMTTPATAGNMWRASKLIGLNVYNEQNEKLGDISEILVDKAGKVEGVVIGVGGFLGMGQRDIKVEMSKLKFVDEAVKTSSTTTTTGTANRPAATTTTTTTADHKWYPDHAVLAGATKDQLKGMPEFKYN